MPGSRTSPHCDARSLDVDSEARSRSVVRRRRIDLHVSDLRLAVQVAHAGDLFGHDSGLLQPAGRVHWAEPHGQREEIAERDPLDFIDPPVGMILVRLDRVTAQTLRLDGFHHRIVTFAHPFTGCASRIAVRTIVHLNFGVRLLIAYDRHGRQVRIDRRRQVDLMVR